MEATPAYAVAIPDHEVDKIEEMVKTAGRFGVYLKDGKGNKTRFFTDKSGVLFCEQGFEKQKSHVSEVIRTSKCLKPKMEDAHRANLERLIREDYPGITDEDVQTNIDMVLAAGRAMEELKAKGMSGDLAKEMVEYVLKHEKPELIEKVKARVEAFNDKDDPNVAARNSRDAIFGELPNRRRHSRADSEDTLDEQKTKVDTETTDEPRLAVVAEEEESV
jgi:hypothetical protein